MIYKKHIVYKTIYLESSRGAIYEELNKNKNVGVQPFHRVTPTHQRHLF